ncbi:MAG: LytTR family DNA-binding domain-containing protein [Saprospiraceae bacterium]
MKNILKKLNEPFPEDISLQHNIRSILGVGVFVTLFLYLLRPFDLNYYSGNLLVVCIGFGALTIFAGLSYDLFGIYVLGLKKDLPSWTLWKWIVNAIFLILFISICNYLFMMYLMAWEDFSWSFFSHMIISTLAVGIFPIIFSGMIVQMNAYKRNQVQAQSLQASLSPKQTKVHTIILAGKNSREDYLFPFADLLYIEAMQNYVSVCHFKKGKIEKTVFRSTIKRMETQTKGSPLIRCHRSFLVNANLIEKVAGNAQGLRLTLKGLPDFEVPVSRKYIPTLRALMA